LKGASKPAALLLGTRNRGKMREVLSILGDLPVEVVLRDDLPEMAEDGATFEENAIAKALAYSRWSGMPTLAEDSGLEVDALEGRPGVRSARFAGEDATDQANVRLLLREMDGVPEARRTARFRCVAAFVVPGRAPITAGGALEGRIGLVPAGSSGFGYDPVFYPDGWTRTVAECEPEAKNAISHRGRALRAIRPAIQAWAEGR